LITVNRAHTSGNLDLSASAVDWEPLASLVPARQLSRRAPQLQTARFAATSGARRRGDSTARTTSVSWDAAGTMTLPSLGAPIASRLGSAAPLIAVNRAHTSGNLDLGTSTVDWELLAPTVPARQLSRRAPQLQAARFTAPSGARRRGDSTAQTTSVSWNAAGTMALPSLGAQIACRLGSAAPLIALNGARADAELDLHISAMDLAAPECIVPVRQSEFAAAQLNTAAFSAGSGAQFRGRSTAQATSVSWDAVRATALPSRRAVVAAPPAPAATFIPVDGVRKSGNHKLQELTATWATPALPAPARRSQVPALQLNCGPFTAARGARLSGDPMPQATSLTWEGRATTALPSRRTNIRAPLAPAAPFAFIDGARRPGAPEFQNAAVSWAVPGSPAPQRREGLSTPRLDVLPFTAINATWHNGYPAALTAAVSWNASNPKVPVRIVTTSTSLQTASFRPRVANPWCGAAEARTESLAWTGLAWNRSIQTVKAAATRLTETPFQPAPDAVRSDIIDQVQVDSTDPAFAGFEPAFDCLTATGCHPAELRTLVTLVAAVGTLRAKTGTETYSRLLRLTHSLPWTSRREALLSLRLHGSVVHGLRFERTVSPDATPSDETESDTSRVAAAVSRLRSSKPRQAYHLFQLALQHEPTSIAALSGQAMALHLMGRTAEAIRAYEKIESWPNLVVIALDQDDPALAREYAERWLAACPDSVDALTALANCDFLEQRFEPAAERCQALVAILPDSFTAWFNLGVARHKSGRLDEAALAYENALRRRPDSADAWLYLGLVRHEVGELTRARQAYGRALAPASPAQEVVECNVCAGRHETSPLPLMRTA
jgi:tetratricopeptide (TPR) repeat protein